MKTPLIVLTGPSGVGKGTLQRQLLTSFPDLRVAVSATTRPARPGERDGQHYHFLSDARFEEMSRAGAFIEQAVYNGHRYGTLRSEIAQLARSARLGLVELEVQGAAQLRAAGVDGVYVFLAPPSVQELRRRLTGRGTEDDAQIERRVSVAEREIAQQHLFDRVVVNHRLDDAYRELSAVVRAALG